MVGFVAVEVAGVPPVNVQAFVVGEFVEVLVKLTDPPAQMVVAPAVKLATGAAAVATPVKLILSMYKLFP